MSFVYPQILWGLLALAIPIIIHLFHFRRFKKVYFSNVKLLKEIKEEKSARNKVRNFLVLLSRLLAMALLIFAFAQPFISKNNSVKAGKNYVSIFIDNSYSMMAATEDVPLIDKTKRRAEEIVEAYDPADQFQILTHELKGSQQRWISKENVRSAIEEIELSPKVNTLSNVLLVQKQSAPADGNHITYMLSDFQKSITDIELEKDTTLEINFIPVQAVKESNIAIDSAWFESVVPSINQNNKLYVRVTNHSAENQKDIRLSITHNGQNRPEGTMDIPARSSITDTINLLLTKAGWQEMEIKIDDYPIQFDDSYYINFNIKESIKVLSINNSTNDRYLTALFRGLNQFDLDNVSESSIQYDKFKDYDLIIMTSLTSVSSGLSASLKTYVENGGNILVFPPRTANVETYNAFLNQLNANSISQWDNTEQAVSKINTSEFVFDNVYTSTDSNLKLPITKGHYDFTSFSARGGEYLLKYRSGQNFLTKYNRGKGKFYVCAAPLDVKYNDLVTNAEVFVPMLYKLSFSATQSDKISYIIGKDNYTEVNNTSSNNEIIYKIKGEEEFIPGQTNMGNTSLINFNNMISKAGFYNLNLEDQQIKGLAFNYDRIESNLDYKSSEELNEEYGASANIISNTASADLSQIIKQKDQGIRFWKWCLILALLFLAIETLLLRFWKL